MLAFILYKNVHITPFQVATIIALKPATSLLSPYWSSAIHGRPDKIITNLVGANFFRYLPFLLLPWIASTWLIIAAFGFYMMLSRATIPAWMEILKHNLPDTKREELISYGTVIDYLGTALVSILAGFVLDMYPLLWRWFFSCTAGLGLLSTFFLTTFTLSYPSLPSSTAQAYSKLLKPWKEVWQLLRRRKDFLYFQIGFMLGGGGLMIMHPALPQFFMDTLHLSFVELGLALAFCKGIGVACTTHFWTRFFRKLTLFHFCAIVTFFAALFPFLLLTTTWHSVFLYLAYVFYGIMQAGSELSWHMSGLVFARKEDSSTFSSTNILTVGIRGCVIPGLGALLLPYLHPLGLMLLGTLLCLSACSYFLFRNHASTINSFMNQ
jgi:predicted MFS family arabinose efflux permease